MSDATRQPDLNACEASTLAELASALRNTGFDDAFLEQCESIAPRMLDAVRLPMVHWWLRAQTSAAATIARIWAYGDPVTRAQAEQALGGSLLDRLMSKGLLSLDAAAADDAPAVSSTIRITPFCGLWVGSDPMHGDDPVMGPGATTTELAQAIPEQAGSVLDIGGGAGSLALVAASRGATRVVSVDLHPRAAQWTAFNATLNGLTIETHTGDLTKPVQGERFDLVVSQPPFVVQPKTIDATTYLHGGAMGDELTMRLLDELPSVMNDGGHALVLFDSPVRKNAALWQRVAEAHGSDDVQAILFTSPGNSPNIQAIGYAASSHPTLGPAYVTAALRYRDHLEAQGITKTEHVLATLRRQPGEAAMSVTIEQPRLSGVTAASIAETWNAVRIASQPIAEFLNNIIGLPEGTWLVQEEGDGEQRLKIRLPPGRGDVEELSDAAALLVDLVRQPAALSTVVQQYAEACGAKPEEVLEGVVDFVRQSLVSGRLVAKAPNKTEDPK